jgi:hypothetical protein
MAFGELQGLGQEDLHRFVIGEDREPRVLSTAELDAELGDPFATLLLRNGVFPKSAGDVLKEIEAATAAQDPLRTTQFFLLGEGSQVPFATETASLRRNLRFVAACGGGPDGPDLLLSAFNPDETDVELMAWDRIHGGFNYYRTVGDGAWVFAGNSRHAVSDPTQGKGPFESHRSGSFMMKELRTPWVHWDSPAAKIQPTVFAEDDPLRAHPWFVNRAPGGALTCEKAVAVPAMRRWARARFEAIVTAGHIEDPVRIMLQVLGSPAVNLISSHTESANTSAETVEIPPAFFIDGDGIVTFLGLPGAAFSAPGSIYRQALETFDVHLTDAQGFEQAGDTHFAFVVPQRGLEDSVVVEEAVRIGMLTRRLAAALLMTDFPNPIFSERRQRLLKHVPDGPVQITGGTSDFSQRMADAILAAAPNAGPTSPEQEFAELWDAGDDFAAAFSQKLNHYYAAVTARLQTQEGFGDFMRLAESRRERVRAMPINESPLLFASTNIPGRDRILKSDGTVEEV